MDVNRVRSAPREEREDEDNPPRLADEDEPKERNQSAADSPEHVDAMLRLIGLVLRSESRDSQIDGREESEELPRIALTALYHRRKQEQGHDDRDKAPYVDVVNGIRLVPLGGIVAVRLAPAELLDSEGYETHEDNEGRETRCCCEGCHSYLF